LLKIHQLFIRTFVLIFLAVAITLSIVTYFWSKNIYIDQIEKNLIKNIDTFSIVLKDLNNVDTIIKDLKSQINIRITIIDEKGNVIAESDKDKNLLENHGSREEVLQAKDYGTGRSTRYSSSINKELLYIAKKVVIDKRIYFIRMADYTDKITDNFMRLSAQIFSFVAMFIIVAFLASYFISLKIKKETEAILYFLTELSSKKPSYALNSNFTVEFHRITKLLNKVAVKLSKRETKSKTDCKTKTCK